MAQNQGIVGAQQNADSSTLITARLGKGGEQMVSEFMPRYYENTYRGRVFSAGAIVTAPVIWSTAAGTGGPLLWNNSAALNIVPLFVGFSSSVVTTVAGGLGLAFGPQNVVPTTTTAIDFPITNMLVGSAGATTQMNAYRLGTVTTASLTFVPYAQFHTGALTVDTTGVQWIDLGGLPIVGPKSFISFGSGSATLTTLVVTVTAVWAEVPI